METTRGVKFCPDNPECIALLMSKVLSPDLSIPNIHNCNPYDHTHLPVMFAAAQKEDLYFFTKLTRKGSKSGSKNANRSVSKGTWHGEQNRNVTYGDLGLVGTLHTFSYTEPGSVNDGCFLMTEYHLLEDTCLDYDPLKNHVLCVLRPNNSSVSKKKRKSSDLSSNQEAAAAPMKKKVRTFTAPPINDQQPLAIEEAAFQNSETPQDAADIQALSQVFNCDNGRCNNHGDPLLYAPPTAAAASNVGAQISPYDQYSCQVEESQQPLAVEEAAFQNSETPQDAAVIQSLDSLPQVYNCDDGRFNNLGDPLLYAPPTAAAAALNVPPIYDQQPQAVEEAAFQKSESPQDAADIQALSQVYNCDDGRFNNHGDPLLYAPPTAAAASNVWDQISPYNQYLCQVEESQFQTALLAAESLYSALDFSPFYSESEPIYGQLLAREDPNFRQPFGEPDIAPLL